MLSVCSFAGICEHSVCRILGLWKEEDCYSLDPGLLSWGAGWWLAPAASWAGLVGVKEEDLEDRRLLNHRAADGKRGKTLLSDQWVIFHPQSSGKSWGSTKKLRGAAVILWLGNQVVIIDHYVPGRVTPGWGSWWRIAGESTTGITLMTSAKVGHSMYWEKSF